MNAKTFVNPSTFTTLMTSIIDLENSNLPIDYFTSVLPRAQYGDESVAAVSVDGSNTFFKLQDPNNDKIGPVFSGSSTHTTDNLIKSPTTSVIIPEGNVAPVQTLYTNQLLIGLKGRLNADASLKISALRSATALQKYKEIQNSNDPDFASQVLAHFGIKPKVDSRTSVFIGGDDKTLSINPQVNTNFLDGGQPDIKAIGVGDLSAGCKFSSSTYGIIIGIYRAVPQLDYSCVGIDRCLFKSDATDFPIPELDSIGMQTQYRCELSSPTLGLCSFLSPYTVSTRDPVKLKYL